MKHTPRKHSANTIPFTGLVRLTRDSLALTGRMEQLLDDLQQYRRSASSSPQPKTADETSAVFW